MVLDLQQIKEILPHRYPFLFVDAVIELEPGKKAVGIKNVTGNEYYFEGHFPGKPVMPGVLIIEAVAQVGSIMILCLPQYEGKIGYFAGLDRIRFRKQVGPGDRLTITTVLLKHKSGIGKVDGRVFTDDGELVLEGEFMFAVR